MEKRLLFVRARQSGITIKEAARIAGINEQTGYIWSRRLRDEKAKDAARSAVLEKNEELEILAAIAREELNDPRDRVTATQASIAAQGHAAPSRSIVTTFTLPPSVADWLIGLDARIEAQPDAPALPAPQRAMLESHNVGAATPSAAAGAAEQTARVDPPAKASENE